MNLTGMTGRQGRRLTISWEGTGASRVEEISYLAIGPVSPPGPGPY